MATQELFFEIGMEELPASYVEPALKQLASGMEAALDDASIAHGAVQTFATPRRLGVVIADVAEVGEDCHREEFGPPVRVAFDDEGNPRVPAQKFAEKVGKDVAELGRKEKDGKGEYLVAEVVDKGVQTATFLQQNLPGLLAGLHFPKAMRWGAEKQAFARPVHWICARLGEAPVEVTFAGITSGLTSRGHRFLAPDEFAVTDYASFQAECEARYVVLSPATRRQRIEEGAKKLAQEAGGKLWHDDDLLDLNAQLSEYPVPLIASYDPKYLELPHEVLRTSMKSHLKCFAVVDEAGKLLPYFIPVAGLPSTNVDLVREGNQRVLRARLEDAQFFYQEDRKSTLESFVERLDKVVYQGDLGSYGDKVRRVSSTVKGIAGELGFADAAADAERAAHLYKADLNTLMVYEFPELQGIMGRDYAIHSGENQAVADAIVEHYMPAGADDDVPTTEAGKALAIAERLDTLVGGFSVGLRPTGSADPYGLRRQAITMLRILKEHSVPGRLSPLLALAAKPLAQHIGENQDALLGEVLAYLRDRLPQIYANDGWSKDLIDAVCVDDLIGRYPLAELDSLFQALQKALESGILAKVAYSFKRVSNILKQGVKKIDADDPLLADLSDEERTKIGGYRGLGTLTFREDAPAIDASLLKEKQEISLAAVYEKVRSQVEEALKTASFGVAFEALSTLQGPIDDMFDHVMVMADDAALLTNRLALLRGIARLAFLDFGKIDTSDLEAARQNA